MGVKVFTATKAREREMLGEVVTRWLADNPRARVIDKIVTQSSDSAVSLPVDHAVLLDRRS